MTDSCSTINNKSRFNLVERFQQWNATREERKDIRNQITVISRAHKTLSDPNNWVQGTMVTDSDGQSVKEIVRDESGQRVGAEVPEASCFCAEGALRHEAIQVAGPGRSALTLYYAASKTVNDLAARRYGQTLIGVNDAATEGQSKRKFGAAICNTGNETARKRVLSTFGDAIGELKERL